MLATGYSGGEIWRADPWAQTLTRLATIPSRRTQLVTAQNWTRAATCDDGKAVLAFAIDSATFESRVDRVDLQNGQVTSVRRANEALITRLIDLVARDATLDGKTVVYASETATQASELFRAACGDFAAPERLTFENEHLDQYRFGESRLIRFTNPRDGQLHSAVLLTPPGFDAERSPPCPLLAWIYPTDVADLLHRFGGEGDGAENLQVFTTRGICVLLPEYRFGEPGRQRLDVLAGVMPAIDRVIELGIVDSARLGVAGHSDGGYSTVMLLTMTQRFKAAMATGGLFHQTPRYFALYEGGFTPYLEQMEARLDGRPWEIPYRYVDESVIYQLDRIKTPLLLLHGRQDALPIEDAEAVFVGLRQLGVPVELVEYPNAGHSIFKAEHLQDRVDYLRRFVEWFETFLLPTDTDISAATR